MINNILYSDEIIHDDEMKKVIGEHKTSSIPNVEEEQLETILDIIFKSNPGVIFKTIQYSRKSKELIFYTDKDLSLKEYFKYYKSLPKPFQYKKLTSKEDVLNEIEDILNSGINTDSNCISLYDVLLLIRKTKYDFNNIKKGYENQLNYLYHYKDPYIKIGVKNFDYNKNELNITYGVNSKDEYTMIFSKENKDLFLKGNSGIYEYKIFSQLGNILLDLYNEFEKYRSFFEENKYNLRSVNSNFCIDVNSYGIVIKDSDNITGGKHLTITSYSYTNHYDNMINSYNILNAIVGHEDEIFKRIFIKISDCPEWSRQLLTEFRQGQLDNMKKIESYKKKKQRRLALIQRIFPFIEG